MKGDDIYASKMLLIGTEWYHVPDLLQDTRYTCTSTSPDVDVWNPTYIYNCAKSLQSAISSLSASSNAKVSKHPIIRT